MTRGHAHHAAERAADRAGFEQARREADEGDVVGEEEMAALMRERLARRADQ